jgi:acetoin utilization protein AcuB
MLEKNMYKLPVVAEEGDLAGIVTKKDLLYVLPSSAALLSVSEIDDLFGKRTIARVMTRRVISVSEDCPLEEAARILVDHKIGSLPVMRGHLLVGMITKRDIFRVMMEALGGRVEGPRITIRLHEDTGELGAITDRIVQLGGALIHLSTFWGDAFHQTVTLKVQGIDPQELISFLEKNIGVEVIDYHESGPEYQPQFVSSPGNKEAFRIRDLGGGLLQLMDSK